MFRLRSRFLSTLFVACSGMTLLVAQESSSVSTPVAPAAVPAAVPAIVPAMVNFPGTLTDLNGKPITGLVGVTFLLYREQQGGAPLWMETQNVRPDKAGHYSVMLGSTTSQGLPADLFVSGEARWLGVQVSGQAEQPRVLLLSVPYALKAADAETLGGFPLSAFVRAQPGLPAVSSNSAALAAASTSSPDAATAPPPASSNVTTTGGTVNAIPLFTTAKNIQNSILTQTGITAVNVAGKLNLPAQGVATASAGKFSRPEAFVASAFNSSSSVAVPQTFQLQVEPAANNTAAPYGTLNLLYGSGTAVPAETGLKINNKGVISFVAGQTFPGTGKITSVIAGTGLTGGGTTGAVTLNLNTANIPQLGTANDFTAPQEFKTSAGVGVAPSTNGYTPLSVGGATSFGTWLALANSSSGGHTWNIISAGAGNAEGAGNLGITDLTGKSTIWLEGNTNTANLTATGTVGAAALVVSSTAGAAIIDADGFGKNAGGPTPGLRFGGGSSGEGIASNRVIGLTKFGLDFYTNYTPRMSILQSGQVAVGTASPGAQLGVVGSSNAYPGISSQGGSAASGSGQTGGDGIDAYGNTGDLATEGTHGGNGISGFGASGGTFGGAGGVFTGGNYGDGVIGYSGGPTSDFGPFAGSFDGDIYVNGDVSNESIHTRIDHPLDPANQYLVHSSVGSSEMKNMYDGTITTDASGQAVVELPDWFESLNRDFRYQLTVIGQFAQAIVAEKIADHHFTIRTDKPNVEVSWQITGVRQDAWANAHRTPVEQQKNARERGHYLHPELYGAPEESSIEWARHPQIMKRLKAMRQTKAHVAAAPQP
jgi:trimeric autotransporter adhesin